MKLWITTFVAAAIAAAAVAGASAGPTATIAFTSKFSGVAVTEVTDTVADITANGKGSATLIGAGRITGKGTGDTSVQPCVPFNGTGSMIGARGTIVFKVLSTSSGCGDEAGQQFSIVGRATVTRATGKLKGAKGTLKFTGDYDRGTGAFTVKFFGTLKR